jgi:hypothetical protein
MAQVRTVVAALPAYDIGREMGRGSFGAVRAGRHRQLGREVAIKELHSSLASDPAVRARFVKEAQLLAGLDHPHIVPVYDYVEAEGLCLLVMENLPGGTVWDLFAARGVSAVTACGVAMATSAALDHAHRHGVLHRDVKPDNLLLSGQKVLKVTDFGIAEVMGGRTTLATADGQVLGTPAYMAPEQARGLPVGPEVDVYSAGVLLYELLAGSLPFSEEGTEVDVIRRRIVAAPRPILETAPDVDHGLAEVVMRAIEPVPEDRYASPEAFGVAVGQAASAAFGPGWLARSELPMLAAGPILASAAVGRAGAGSAGTVTYDAAQVAGDLPDGFATPVQLPTADSMVRARRPHVLGADFVPVDRVLETRRAALRPLLAAVGLVLVAGIAAFVGITSPDHNSNGSDTEVNDTRIDEGPVPIDFNEDITVDEADPNEIDFSVGGISIGSATRNGQDYDGSSLRFLAAGDLTGSMTVNGENLRFGVAPPGFGLLTVPGVLSIAAVLFVLAYAESLLRPVRRGRRVSFVRTLLGVTALGALGGVGMVNLVWALGGAEPTVATLIACALLSAAAGATLVLSFLPPRRLADRARPA